MTDAPEFTENAAEYIRAVAERRWQRLLETAEVAHGKGALGGLINLPSARAEWFKVWGASEFVANYCIGHPETLHDLQQSGALDAVGRSAKVAAMVTEATADCYDEAALHKALRRLRMREMVRIAWRDLGGLSDLDETMECVSALADSCIQTALRFHQMWLQQIYGVPCSDAGKDAGKSAGEAHFVVLALGKLGGQELNYSSDVDLVFAYSHSGQTRRSAPTGSGGVRAPEGHEKTLDNQAFFLKLGRKIVQALHPITADGFVFRTDLRLRPNGESAPIVLSFNAMQNYIKSSGRTWERYAYVKARVIAGESRCGEALLAMLQPFIYRTYLDFGSFEEIRTMKRLIEREIKGARTRNNIKLGWGGIREVEFLVQSHQLTRGGREKSLQTASLYQALRALVDLRIFNKDEANQLKKSYEFLRNVEHRLQMVADQQTQTLPESPVGRLVLAGSLQFTSWDEFVAELHQQRSFVQARFRAALEGAAAVDSALNATIGEIIAARLPNDRAVEVLARSGFTHADALPDLLKGFHASRLYQSYAEIEKERIDRLIPLAMAVIKDHANASKTLSRLIEVLSAIGRRTAYFSLLIENPFALSQLLGLCAASPWLSALMGNNPVILDQLLDPIKDVGGDATVSLREQLAKELRARIKQIDAQDEEAHINLLREFQHAQVLRIAAADLATRRRHNDGAEMTAEMTAEKGSVEQVNAALVCLAEILIDEVFNAAMVFTQRKLAKPTGVAGVIAYGKFASGELGYYSDLDIVICFSRLSVANEYFWNRVGRRFIHLLTTRTRSGILYQIDMRLRPSGRSGTLVTSLKGFFDYQSKHAWTWEHQALVRARMVVGSDEIRCDFEAGRREILCVSRCDTALKKSITDMRQKMIEANCQSTDTQFDLKLDEGGIVDIEFLVQYWVLKHAHDHHAITEPRGNSDILQMLKHLDLVDAAIVSRLNECYRIYLRLSLELKLQDLPLLAEQGELLAERRFVASVWDAVFAQD